ncbi:hypothetical protein FACS1894153_4120 [Bacteroidia bacterium]|nr:hypothetical protein FACS1894153_4120 [Bacteroidia bacterium]
MKIIAKLLSLILVSAFAIFLIACKKDKITKTNWIAPNYSMYEHSMSFVTQVSLSKKITNNTNVEISAFCGEECRGWTKLVYDDDVQKTLCFLTIYSNIGRGEIIEIKVFDPIKGVIYNNATTLIFESNASMGTSDDVLTCK